MSTLQAEIQSPRGGTFTLPTGLFINNEWVDSIDARRLDSVNPATEKVIIAVSAAGPADVDKAVKAAEAAFDGPWKAAAGTARGKLLLKLADLVERDQEILATIEAMDNGKPYSQALGDIEEVFSVFRYYGGWADKMYGQTIETGRHKFTYTLREPIGVCGLIIPWNYPLGIASWKLGPCLACGNTAVLKPAEQTPLSILYFANLVVEAGFPPGVINIVNGHGRDAGTALVDHPGVRKIGFTGSTATGKAIMRSAAGTMKNISLETGGKSPLIVFEDADLENAAKWTHYGIFGNMGQICTATSRIYVHERIYDRFLEIFIAHTKNTSVVGDPFEESSWHGPQVSKDQYEKILGYIESARTEGAEVMRTGTQAENQKGYYIHPTILTKVEPHMTVYKEEIFGPVAVVCKFSDEDAVIAAANDSDYGLAGALFTSDVTRAIRVSEALQAGNIWINSSNNSDYRVPFGGMKESGIGRDLGEAALASYSTTKAVHLSLTMAKANV